MEGVRIKKKLDKKRGAPEEGRGLHFQPIFVLAFLKSASTQALPSKKKNQTPRSGKTWNLHLKILFHLFQGGYYFTRDSEEFLGNWSVSFPAHQDEDERSQHQNRPREEDWEALFGVFQNPHNDGEAQTQKVSENNDRGAHECHLRPRTENRRKNKKEEEKVPWKGEKDNKQWTWERVLSPFWWSICCNWVVVELDNGGTFSGWSENWRDGFDNLAKSLYFVNFFCDIATSSSAATSQRSPTQNQTDPSRFFSCWLK